MIPNQPPANSGPAAPRPRPARRPAGLSAERERYLADRIHAGDNRARDELVEGNLNLCHFIALRYAARRLRGVELDDLLQEGAIGLIIAASRYDPGEHGTRFSTYAVWWVRQRIGHAFISGEFVRLPAYQFHGPGADRVRVPVCSLGPNAGIEAPASPAPIDRLIHDEEVEALRARLGHLSAHDLDALIWYASEYEYRKRGRLPRAERASKRRIAARLIDSLKSTLNSEGATIE